MRGFHTYPKKLSESTVIERAFMFKFFKTVRLNRPKDAILIRNINNNGTKEFLKLFAQKNRLARKEKLLDKTVLLVILTQIVVCLVIFML